MKDETSVTIYQSQQVEVPAYQPETELIPTLEEAIDEWLEESFNKSRSIKTKTSYETTLQSFRNHLQGSGHDLDSEPRIVARAARQWVELRSGLSNRADKPISKNTYYQRLAILSSFYHYAVREEVIESNPIEKIKRDKKGKKEPARPLAEEDVRTGLAKIDRSTPEGQRDYMLLQVALNTGHRASELAGIRLKHLTFHQAGCSIEWERGKGDKDLDASTLPPKTAQTFKTYLTTIYGDTWQSLPGETPVWPSFSKRNAQEPIGIRTISNVCKAYLGSSKVHTTRRTAAKRLMDNNYTLAQIGKFLGHSNLKTTSDYVEELAGYDISPQAKTLEEAFSLD